VTTFARRRGAAVVYHLVVIALSFLMIYPVLWLIASSFKGPSEIFVDSYSLLPHKLAFSNYADGWKGFGGITFTTFFANTFVIVLLSTFGQVASSALVAYGFSRIKFKGRRFWFVCMIATLLLPPQVLYIPQYLLFSKLGWLNSFKPLIVPSYFGVPFFIFLIMQFVRGIPTELDESAKIDGASKYVIFVRIILPLVVPALITSAIFAFYWKWEEFFEPLLYLSKTQLYPVSMALKTFADPSSLTNWGAMFAMSVLSLVPVFVVFLLFQRYLVEGISTTGMKG
jgi:multiple sugar transport system permease protein